MSHSATKDVDTMALGCGFFEMLCRKQLCEIIYELDVEDVNQRKRGEQNKECWIRRRFSFFLQLH